VDAPYPGASRLLITADGGGSNGYRTRGPRGTSRANLCRDPEPHTEPSLRDRLRRPWTPPRITLRIASIGTSRGVGNADAGSWL
jgi:hypothetical protein